MRHKAAVAALATATMLLTSSGAHAADSSSEPGTPVTIDAGMSAAPYLYLGWGEPPSPSTVMAATGVDWFTMAFILSDGGCSPAWDGARPLHGGVDEQAINEIRANGGDIVPSIGGWSGNKLGPNCGSATELAAAYQEVIDAYDLNAIDVDIENSDEFENEIVQDRILGALKIVEQNNPGITTILTFGTGVTGPTWWGQRLIDRAAELDVGVDVYTIMPFNFGGGSDMYGNTVSSAEGLSSALQAANGWDVATAYAHMGISGMNGLSDQGEETTTATWTSIRDWARSNGLARLAFWSVNRDRPCSGAPAANCSGTPQSDWEFTAITAAF
ncbi:Chitinase [Stackebrandtia soli]